MSYTSNFEESVLSDLQEIDSFVPTQEQLKAIRSRNFNKAYDLGVTLNEYLYFVSPKYRSKLARLIA